MFLEIASLSQQRQNAGMIAAAVLVLIVITYRVLLGIAGANDLTWLHNFSPMAAVVLCGAVYFPRKIAVIFPMGALLISNMLLNDWYQRPLWTPEMFGQYLALGTIALLGWMLRNRAQGWKVLTASVAGSIIFYVVTNTGSWWTEPAYAKTFAGWLQALTIGLPNYPPTLVFFRNTLASDLAFTLLFLGCMLVTERRLSPPEAANTPRGLRAHFARRLW